MVSAAASRADRAVGGGGRLAGAVQDALVASVGAAAARGVAGALVLAVTGGVVYFTVSARAWRGATWGAPSPTFAASARA